MASLETKIFNVTKRIQENTSLKNLVPGTTMYSIVEASSYEQMKLESNQEVLELKNSIVNATGRDLDFIGEKFFGIKRRRSIAPVVSSDMKILKLYTTSTFGGINSGNSITILPSEIIMEGVSKDGYWKFTNQEQITLNAGDKEQFINASLILGPYDIIPTNSISTHNFKNYADAANNTLKVTNINVVATGRPEETDDNFRYRITNALKSFVKTNYFGIHDACTDLPGISDVQISNASNGGGTFTIYAQSISPQTSNQLLTDIEKITMQNVPPWVSFNIVGPNYIGLKLALTVSVSNLGSISNQENLKTQIINTASSYINNVPSRSFYIPEVSDSVLSSNPNFTNVSITSAYIYTGQDEFRSVKTIDLTDDLAKYIFIGSNEKLIVEPIADAITVSFL